jgi:hypothetical protein
MKYIIALFISLFYISCSTSSSDYIETNLPQESGKPLGTWVLNSNNLDDNSSKSQFFANCSSRGIKHIDQSIDMQLLDNGSYEIIDKSSLVDFIIEVYKEGMTFNVLINDPDAFNKTNYEDSFRKLETIIDFNTELTSLIGIGVLGVKYRVDLASSTGWAKSHHQATYDYLYYLFQAKEKIKRENATLLLSVDASAGWDSSSYAISFNTKDKKFIYHIIDIVDYVTLFSFGRDEASIYSAISDELRYVRDKQKTNCIVPSLAVSPQLNESDTFYGIDDNGASFWETLNGFQDVVEDDMRVPLIMIENYHHFDQIPAVRPN